MHFGKGQGLLQPIKSTCNVSQIFLGAATSTLVVSRLRLGVTESTAAAIHYSNIEDNQHCKASNFHFSLFFRVANYVNILDVKMVSI